MPVIAARPVAAPKNNPRMCPHCLEFVPAGYSVICVHGFRQEGAKQVPYRLHLHPWSLTSLDRQIRVAYEQLMAEGATA